MNENEQQTTSVEVESQPTSSAPTQEVQAPPSWRDGLAEDLREHPDLAGYESIDHLARNHLEMLANRPPENPDAYQFATPEGLQVDEQLLASFKSFAHQAGLSQAQMGKFASWYGDLSMQHAAMVRQQQEMADWAERSELGRLREEWGLRDFDARKERAVKQASKVFDARTVRFFSDAGFMSDPMFLRGLDRISEAVSDDAFVEGKRTGPSEMQRTPGGAPMLRYDNSPTMKRGQQ